MKSFSDEKSSISELQDEAEKRKKQLTENINEQSGAVPWVKGKGKVFERGRDSTVSKKMASFLEESKEVKGSSSSSNAPVEQSTISKFLSDSSKPSSSGSTDIDSKNLAAPEIISDFISKSSKGNTKEGNSVQSLKNQADKLPSLPDFTSSSYNKKQEKSSYDSQVLPEVNPGLFQLSLEKTEKSIDKDLILEYIKNIKVSRSPDEKFYEKLIESLSVGQGDKLNGLAAWLAQSSVWLKSSGGTIDVSSEIIRKNYEIHIDGEFDQPQLLDSSFYLDESLSHIDTARTLASVSSYIEKMKGIKKVKRIKKAYHIPNWFNRTMRNTMDMRVKQLNKLSIAPSKFGGDNFKQNAFTESLNKVLRFDAPTEEELKEGFSAAGIDLDTLSEIRKKMSIVSIDKSFYESIKDRRVVEFDDHGFVHYDTSSIGKPFYLPQVTLGELKIPKFELGIMRGGGSWMDSNQGIRESFKHKVFNTSVQALLNKAPDFRQNMYLGMFIFTKDDSGSIIDFSKLTNSIDGYIDDDTIGLKRPGNLAGNIAHLTKAYEKVLDAYFVRIRSIKVPGASIESYSIPVLNREVKKVTPIFKEAHQISLDIDVDELGLILRSFNLLTGQFGNIVGESNHNTYAANLFPVTFSPENKGQLDLVITYNDFRINRNNQDPQGLPRRSSFTPAIQNVQTESDDVEDRTGTRIYGDPKAYRKFILEDVKIMGIDAPLKFQRDSVGKLSTSVSIIFRRITTVDNNKTN